MALRCQVLADDGTVYYHDTTSGDTAYTREELEQKAASLEEEYR